ncbi:MAG: rRNA maturation RNase YbeY [Pseudomonadota bacterium]
MQTTYVPSDNFLDAETSSVEIEIIEKSELWKNLDIIEQGIASAVEETIYQNNATRDVSYQVTIVLSNDEEIQNLNNLFRNINKPTNVLSFPFGDNSKLPPLDAIPLGDIVLSFETIEHEANTQGIKFDHHLYHMVIHGLLHLLGYDHETEKDAIRMEAKEIEIMQKLALPNPYAN